MKIKNSKLKINSKYFPHEIEPYWQNVWDKEGLYKFDPTSPRLRGASPSEKSKGPHFTKTSRGKKYYNLVELPYPSGDLHLGHWFAFVPPDAHARYKKMSGYNVFFPNGFDAFGLPAENAAIKKGIHPKDWTFGNIKTMRSQFSTMGTMIDWSHTAITCQPDYYKWNQWIFLKMFEKGIAYRGKALSNWCPVDQTVLANEHIENGCCWRCGAEVVQKEVEQWFLKITDYAEDLIWPSSAKATDGKKASKGKDDKQSVDWPAGHARQASSEVVAGWPKQVRDGQNNWIGRSEGTLIRFKIKDLRLKNDEESHQQSAISNQQFIEVFTTRPETVDGATFMVVAPEHEIVATLLNENRKVKSEKLDEVRDYVDKAKKKTEKERKEDRTKSGVFSGLFVKNPATGKEIPVWIADYVLAGYGTGAIMAVPYADARDKEFAKQFDLPIAKTSFKAKPKGTKKIIYHLRDWSISRQRYWGTPIPIIYCHNCWEAKSEKLKIKSEYGRDFVEINEKKHAIITVPEKDLPVELPYNVDYTPKGKPPLASAEEWLSVKCPKCKGEAKRDAETLDTFFDSAWYFFRYVTPNFEKGPFDKEKVKAIMPVDIYFGGSEHTLGHTLYARFFTKFFKEIGLVEFGEFARKRSEHGIVLGPDGAKMSKSRGNVVNPDDLVKEFGADTVRLYLCFMMPYGATAPWSKGAISGVYRFLKRVWELYDKFQISNDKFQMSNEDELYMHRTIKNVGKDLEMIHFNTAVSSMMSWINYLYSKKNLTELEYSTFLKLLAPFAPHITEELFQLFRNQKSKIKNQKFESIHLELWPEYDQSKIVEEKVTIAVQINGKLRDTIRILNQEARSGDVVEKEARKSEKVAKYIGGKEIKKVIYVPGKIINFVI